MMNLIRLTKYITDDIGSFWNLCRIHKSLKRPSGDCNKLENWNEIVKTRWGEMIYYECRSKENRFSKQKWFNYFF